MQRIVDSIICRRTWCEVSIRDGDASVLVGAILIDEGEHDCAEDAVCDGEDNSHRHVELRQRRESPLGAVNNEKGGTARASGARWRPYLDLVYASMAILSDPRVLPALLC
mmetsp:Transcript_21125/g.62529  ORF Transcript_21125/g.62529 Transcript_21125/m.62529 type:complete len:110 (-) Transcript_21125:1094-1423(-)